MQGMSSDFWELFSAQILGALALGSTIVFAMFLVVVLFIYGFLRYVRAMMDPVDEQGNRIAPLPNCPKCARKNKVSLGAAGAFHCANCHFSFKKKATK
jgi:hypothetical protein